MWFLDQLQFCQKHTGKAFNTICALGIPLALAILLILTLALSCSSCHLPSPLPSPSMLVLVLMLVLLLLIIHVELLIVPLALVPRFTSWISGKAEKAYPSRRSVRSNHCTERSANNPMACWRTVLFNLHYLTGSGSQWTLAKRGPLVLVRNSCNFWPI
jgi:hypothetical protein